MSTTQRMTELLNTRTADTTAVELEAMKRINNIRAELKTQFIQRDAEIDGLCVALLAGTNMLLLGPPGTAKSLLTTVFAKALAVPDSEYFEIQCNAYTVPEQLFGPLMISKLQNDEYERKTAGYLPTARVAYLDEIFNMNQTQLNTLNKVLNEHQFDQGPRRDSCPLELCVGAANVYPQGDLALEALYDRFLVRFWTPYINTRNGMRDLLTADAEPGCTVSLEDGDTGALREACRNVLIPEAVIDAVLDIRDDLARKGIEASDRRWRSMLKLVRATAALDYRTEANLTDVLVLADSLWDKHEERPVIYSVVAERCAPAIGEAQRILDGMVAEFSAVDVTEQDHGGATRGKEGRKRLIGIANQAVREIQALQGADECEAIQEMYTKVKAMKRVVARAAAQMDHRVGHLLGK